MRPIVTGKFHGHVFLLSTFQLGEFQIANFIVRLLTTAVTSKPHQDCLSPLRTKSIREKFPYFTIFV